MHDVIEQIANTDGFVLSEYRKCDVICIIAWTVKKELKYSKNINANCTVNMICERMKVSDDGT